MRKLNVLLAFCAFLLLTISFIPQTLAQGEPITYPEYFQEWTWVIPVYAPTKVNINYVYTHNHSIKDISSVGSTSLYRHSGGPTNIVFEAEDLDTYKYTVELFYSEITKQRITVGIWSGTQQAQPVYEYEFFTLHTVIHVTLQVTEEPKYPSADETAEATLFRLEETWVDYTKSLEETVRKQETTMIILIIAAVFSMILSTISLSSTIAKRGKK